MGYVNWAKILALAPLMLSKTFGRVAFPAFSRIQEDHELLARAVKRSICCMTLSMFPITALTLAHGPGLSMLFLRTSGCQGSGHINFNLIQFLREHIRKLMVLMGLGFILCWRRRLFLKSLS